MKGSDSSINSISSISYTIDLRMESAQEIAKQSAIQENVRNLSQEKIGELFFDKASSENYNFASSNLKVVSGLDTNKISFKESEIKNNSANEIKVSEGINTTNDTQSIAEAQGSSYYEFDIDIENEEFDLEDELESVDDYEEDTIEVDETLDDLFEEGFDDISDDFFDEEFDDSLDNFEEELDLETDIIYDDGFDLDGYLIDVLEEEPIVCDGLTESEIYDVFMEATGATEEEVTFLIEFDYEGDICAFYESFTAG